MIVMCVSMWKGHHLADERIQGYDVHDLPNGRLGSPGESLEELLWYQSAIVLGTAFSQCCTGVQIDLHACEFFKQSAMLVIVITLMSALADTLM